MEFSWQFILRWGPFILEGLVLTVKMFALSAFLALMVGTIVAALLRLGIRPLNALLKIYISIFRNSPLLVYLFFFFYGLPAIGVYIAPFWCGVLGITLNEGAFLSEIIRGAIQGIPRGDWEAADSLALSRFQVLRFVVVPQALRNAIPAIAGQLSIVMKDTSLMSLITLAELTYVGNFIYDCTFDITALFIVAVIYIVLFSIFNLVTNVVESRTRIRR